MKRRLRFGRPAELRYATLVLLSLCAAASQAQVLSVASDAGRVLVMPIGPITTADAVVDGVSVSLGIEGNFRVYRAAFRCEAHTARVALATAVVSWGQTGAALRS